MTINEPTSAASYDVNAEEDFAHTTVLLNETVDACVWNPDGVYVDGTFGRGGHSRTLLSKLSPKGRLIGIDKDPRAISAGQALEQQDGRFSIAHGSFAELTRILAEQQIDKIDGLLLDLGVSSPQLDDAERGFSFLRDGPLDMRMDSSSGQSAADWVAETSEAEIARVLKEYGEERFARRMAAAIVKQRSQMPITRTAELAELIKQANPAWEKHKHPATRAFQAIRIAVNNELGDLETILAASIDCLCASGRLSIISFHSLEDRIVKRFIRDQERGRDIPPGVPVTDDQLGKTLRRIGKAIKPSRVEVERNPRARSAVLRIAERLD